MITNQRKGHIQIMQTQLKEKAEVSLPWTKQMNAQYIEIGRKCCEHTHACKISFPITKILHTMFQPISDIFLNFEKEFLHYCRTSACWNECWKLKVYRTIWKRSTASGFWKVIIRLYLVVISLHLKYNIHFLALQFKNWESALHSGKDHHLKHLTCEEKLRKFSLFSLEKNQLQGAEQQSSNA